MKKLLFLCALFTGSTIVLYGQLQRLSFSDLSQNGHFGKRHSIYDNYALVSEPNYSTEESVRLGRVHIFKREGAQWTHQGTIEPLNKNSYTHFGYDIAVYDKFLAVSAPSGAGGKVFIFERQSGDEWTLIQEIQIPDELKKVALHVNFGEHIELNNDWLMISAPGYPGTDDPLIKTGGVFAYQRQGNQWVFQQLILPQDQTKHIQFGFDIDLTSSWFTVSATKADGGAPNSGVVYLFKQEGNTWTLDYTFINPASRSYELFGHDVEVNGNIVVIGVPMHTRISAEGPFGAAHVFQRLDDTWIRTALLEASDGKRNAMFGSAVAIEGQSIAIGAPRYDHPGITDLGKVYVFQSDHGFWLETKSFIPLQEDIQSHVQFGSSLSIYNKQLVMGGHLMNNTLDDSGIAYETDLDFSVKTEEPDAIVPYVNLLPNPGSDFFRIELDKNWGPASDVTLYSSDGQPVMRYSLEPANGKDNINYNTSSLNAGIYFIHVTNGINVFIKKWIKI